MRYCLFIDIGEPSNLWRQQKEILSELGVVVGNSPRNVDTLDRVERLAEVEDEMGEVYMQPNYRLNNFSRR